MSQNSSGNGQSIKFKQPMAHRGKVYSGYKAKLEADHVPKCEVWDDFKIDRDDLVNKFLLK